MEEASTHVAVRTGTGSRSRGRGTTMGDQTTMPVKSAAYSRPRLARMRALLATAAIGVTLAPGTDAWPQTPQVPLAPVEVRASKPAARPRPAAAARTVRRQTSRAPAIAARHAADVRPTARSQAPRAPRELSPPPAPDPLANLPTSVDVVRPVSYTHLDVYKRQPMGAGRVRLIEIVGYDLQPCGGTHVRSTGEIGAVRVTQVEKKGKQNRRVRIAFAPPIAAAGVSA